MNYCISCGKQGARWPKNDPVTCTMHCAANRLLGEYNASPDGFHCLSCGVPECDGGSCQAIEEEEETVSLSWMNRLLRRQP